MYNPNPESAQLGKRFLVVARRRLELGSHRLQRGGVGGAGRQCCLLCCGLRGAARVPRVLQGAAPQQKTTTALVLGGSQLLLQRCNLHGSLAQLGVALLAHSLKPTH